MSSASNKTAFMTVSEYTEKVTPVLKEFNKFIKKNSKFFKRADYYGVVYLTYPQFVADELDTTSKYKPSQEYIDEKWRYNDWERTTDVIPNNIYEKYLEFQEIFKNYFGEGNLIKIEKDETKSNKRSVRRAIDSDLYIDALKDGEINSVKLEEIFSSVGLHIPLNIQKLKTKVESQGYNRSIENQLIKKTKEFEDIVRLALKPYYDKLKNIRVGNIMFIVDKFEKEYNSEHLYKFSHSFSSQSFQVEVDRTIHKLFDQVYHETETNRLIYKRKTEFAVILEREAIKFAENFVCVFVERIQTKLAVINDKLGLPEIELNNVHFSDGEFQGLVAFKWSNGVKIVIEANVIIAGGRIQIEHYRYLLKTFHNGKYIDLENIDSLNFTKELKMN
ncbi:MAG: hypothetical protein RLZZ546_2450 [Bacteroidota bacterium]|jgi:mannose/fructose/N-acetylgalactosamine-specific phosphotransferase system component IIB